MLFATFSGLGGADQELIDLKTAVDRCIQLKSSNSFTDDDVGAGNNLSCTTTALATTPLPRLQAIEKLSFLDNEDNLAVFNIARTLLRQWRFMGMNGAVDRNEALVRQIAAQKLVEVGPLAADIAIAQLSAAAREETDANVLMIIVDGLVKLLTPTTASNIRTEAITSLKILTVASDAAVRTAATAALQNVTSTTSIKPPVALTVVSTPSMFGPVATIAGTAVVAAGVLWFFFGRTTVTRDRHTTRNRNRQRRA